MAEKVANGEHKTIGLIATIISAKLIAKCPDYNHRAGGGGDGWNFDDWP